MKHEAYLQAITDYFYGEAPLTKAVEAHMATCEVCSAHFESLKLLAVAMPMQDMEEVASAYPLDEVLIAAAFEAAKIEVQKRRERLHFIIFIGIALSFICGMGVLVVMGQELQLLYAQAFLSVMAIISLPFVVRHKMNQGY